jgi:hypothetical protein
MSDSLGISADEISSAWQAAIAEIKQNISADSPAEHR